MRRPPRRTAPVHRAAAFQLPGYGQLRLRVPVLPGKFVSVRARPSGNRPLGAVQGAGPGPGYAAPPPPLRGRYRGARPAASVDAPGPQAAGTKARAACGLPQPLSGYGTGGDRRAGYRRAQPPAPSRGGSSGPGCCRVYPHFPLRKGGSEGGEASSQQGRPTHLHPCLARRDLPPRAPAPSGVGGASDCIAPRGRAPSSEAELPAATSAGSGRRAAGAEACWGGRAPCSPVGREPGEKEGVWLSYLFALTLAGSSHAVRGCGRRFSPSDVATLLN